MKWNGLTLASALLSGVCCTVVPAHADLVGDTIHAYYIYPTAGTVLVDLGTFTAPGGGNIFSESYTVSGTQISIATGGGVNWLSASYNGLEFVDVSTNPGITGITLDSSTTAPVSVSDATFTSDSVSFNFQGQAWDANQAAVFDLQFSSVPVPGALPLFASGLAGLGLLGWRMKKTAG